MMPVTADQVATLRAYLKGDFGEYERLVDQLDSGAARTGYSVLLAAAFFKAVDRRFAENGTDADVVEFVGHVRARSERLGDKIDPRIAERLIRAVYTDEDIDDIDGETVIGTQFLLLAALVVDERLDEAGLDRFLAEARALADQ
ncbi:MAG TPA: hypothetical protein VE465_21765 [Streptosporangiaceae bacterium]|jgi:hypothetical protein|nr:hypothetical protein [Streptosporangiaceae bacterium]